MKIGGSMIRISLKNLFENGYEGLIYGGRIEEDIRNNNSFCLVLPGIEDDGCVTFCDGDQINILKKTSGFILVENFTTKRKVWLTPKEFKIAVLNREEEI